MADVLSSGAGTRVALLARAGKAADNLAEAVRQAGAELLVVADPTATDEASLRALAPQAVLVALEPSIETALDKFDALLTDPSITVIFDEADVAAHRSGWDAARWSRHLSAKLRRDDNVLPPGTESDGDWQPSPGKVPAPSAAYADVDMTKFTAEAVASADSVPVNVMPSLDAPLQDGALQNGAFQDAAPAAPVEPAIAPSPPAFDIQALEAAARGFPAEAKTEAEPAPRVSFGDFNLEDVELENVEIESASLESVSLESSPLDDAELDGIALDEISLDSVSFTQSATPDTGDDLVAFDSLSFDAPASAPAPSGLQLDDDAFFLDTLSNDRAGAAGDAPLPEIRFDDFDPAALDFESVQPPPPKRDPEAVLSFEELIAKSMEGAAAVPVSDAGITPDASPAVPLPEPATMPSFSLGELSLAPVGDEEPAAGATEKPRAVPAPAHDHLAALEARISGLSLVDIDDGEPKRGNGDNPFLIDDEPLPPIVDLSTPDAPMMPPVAPAASAGPPPLPSMSAAVSTGVVLIEAGLGGPDPARQLLSSIPADFPAAILVRLHLQGGRYDRLVAQMERAAALPVALAESGASANPGTIYFMPDGLSVAMIGGRLRFVVDEGGGAVAVFAALPAGESAIVFLSGSDPALVDAALAVAATGTIIAAQTPEDCYDGAACAVLRSRGATSGLPVELAGRLAARWPS